MNDEHAVRLYLQHLADPSASVDQTRVRELEAEVSRTVDPLDRLRAITALERARTVDGSALRAGFVRHARAWAEAEGIAPNAFLELGVPREVLVEAGLIAGSRRAGRTTSNRSKVTTGQIATWVLGRSTPFTLADIETELGGSPVTVRKALAELEAERRLTRLGTVPGHHGRGRAPLLFARRDPAETTPSRNGSTRGRTPAKVRATRGGGTRRTARPKARA
jgi:hypothetical protein